MTEYLAQHRVTGHWSSVTIDTAHDSVAQVTQGEHTSTVSAATAYAILDYVRQSGDYDVIQVS